MLSIESPSPSSFVSLPRGQSISSPTGKPPGVIPANNDRPGMPALLPGSVLRIMVSNVGTGLPPSIDISPDPFSMSITGAGAIVVGKQDGVQIMVAEIRLVHLLQRRPLHCDRIRIGRAKGVRGDGAECALDVGAGDLAGDVGQRDALDA